MLGLLHPVKLDQVVKPRRAQVGGPVLDLDALHRILRPQGLAVDPVRPGGVAFNAGFAVRAGRRAGAVGRVVVGRARRFLGLGAVGVFGVVGQGHPAVVAEMGPRRVVGPAVGADRLLRFGGVVRPPLKLAVFRRVDAALLGPAGPVVGGAAVGADHNVIFIRKDLLADRASVAGIVTHSCVYPPWILWGFSLLRKPPELCLLYTMRRMKAKKFP